jgi:hypothetical protein
VTLTRLRSGPLGRPRVLVAVAAAFTAIAALAGGDVGGGALRAIAVVGLLGLGAAALRRARPTSAAPPALLLLEERHFLGKESGVALLAAAGRRLVVGFGPDGVRLIAELGREEVAP